MAYRRKPNPTQPLVPRTPAQRGTLAFDFARNVAELDPVALTNSP